MKRQNYLIGSFAVTIHNEYWRHLYIQHFTSSLLHLSYHQQHSDNQLLGCLAVMVHAECGKVLLPWWFCVLTITSVLSSIIIGSSAAWFFCGHCSYWMWNVLVHSGFCVVMIMSVLPSTILGSSAAWFFCVIVHTECGMSWCIQDFASSWLCLSYNQQYLLYKFFCFSVKLKILFQENLTQLAPFWDINDQ